MTHRDVLNYFSQALEYVRTNGYEKEVEWCRNIPPSEDCTAETFFEEYVWCVLNAGMKEQVARKIYERFMEHKDPSAIKHLGKRAAIEQGMKKDIQWLGELKCANDKIEYLQSLPYIGKITKYHLARNIGIDCVKPDRHLVRLAEKFGFDTPYHMCVEIQKTFSDERLGTIDLVLWRYCNLTSGDTP